MNLPNRLTILRVIMIPFFIFFLMFPFEGSWSRYVALAIFALASLTDFFDGYIARKKNLVTNFGKFMDPLADKLLVCSALICLVELERIPAWVVIVIIAREFVISGVRLIAADDGVVISASKWGKVKTVFQMIMVGFMIGNVEIFSIITAALMWIALALTIISLVDYIIKNIDLLKDIDLYSELVESLLKDRLNMYIKKTGIKI